MKKFTKILAAGACAALLAVGCLGLAGCGESASNDAATDDAASDAPAAEATTLTVGFDAAYPPYGYIVTDGGEGYTAADGNTYTGFDLDLAKAVCDKLGWELVVEPIDWNSKDGLLGSGAINCIWNGFTMEDREDKYTFSEPYMLNEQVVVVKAGSDIASLEDLADKNVITQADSAASDLLGADGDQADLSATFAGGEVATISDYNQAFMQLESGAVDAVACDLSIAAYQLAANPDAFVQLDEALNSEHYAVGFLKGNTEMADQVTEALRALNEDGTVEQLCEKYADQGMSYENWCLE